MFVRLKCRAAGAGRGIWHSRPFPPGWESDPALEHVRERAAAMLELTSGGAPLWGWKPPAQRPHAARSGRRCCRTCDTWCAWRNPLDVAASPRPNQIPRAQAYDAWLRDLVASIIQTAGKPRMFVFFEDYFEDSASAGRAPG